MDKPRPRHLSCGRSGPGILLYSVIRTRSHEQGAEYKVWPQPAEGARGSGLLSRVRGLDNGLFYSWRNKTCQTGYYSSGSS